MPDDTDKKKKDAPEQEGAEEKGPSTPMFSKKGLIVFMAALVIQALVAFLLVGSSGSSAAGDTGEEEGDQARVKLLNIVKVEIDGPSVAVSDGLNGAKYFHVKHIRIYIDSELSEAEQEVLKQNIELRKSEISSKLASFVRQQSIVDLMNRVMIHEMLADKLKPEIIKLLEVTDREIKDVQISNLDYS